MARTKRPIADRKLDVLEELREDQSQTGAQIVSSAQKDDDTRQEVARKFVKYYFVLLTLIIVGVPTYNAVMYGLAHNNDLAISLKDAILTYSAVVGPTVGLVVAYYFKTKHE